MRHPIYARTQSLWLSWAVLPATLAGVGASMVTKDAAAAAASLALLVLVGVALLLILGSFTVEVGEGKVEWRYGVLGWPRWQVALDQIETVEVSSSTWLEGWGIRRTKRGMLYNAHGFQAVGLKLRDGHTLRLGSDEPERLAGFITTARPASPPQRTRPR